VFRVDGEPFHPPCAPPHAWPTLELADRHVLFLLASTTLGDNVGIALFLRSLRERHKPKRIAIACPAAASDIYLREDGLEIYPLWIGAEEFARFDTIIDVAQVPAWQSVDVAPLDPETALLQAFSVAPSTAIRTDARAIAVGSRRLRIAIFPLASSPLRTMPASVVVGLAGELSRSGDVAVHLNRYQRQGEILHRQLAGKLPGGIIIDDGFVTIGQLIDAIDASDYAVFADSGPAHLAKLTRTPGVTLFTSAAGEVLQGRFTNQRRWQVPFSGPHCRAPCGLAKLRRTGSGVIGCMGSLGVDLGQLPDAADAPDRQVVDRLMGDEPVPCVASLRATPDRLIDFVVSDLRSRTTQYRG
jgi:hypothetical protein